MNSKEWCIHVIHKREPGMDSEIWDTGFCVGTMSPQRINFCPVCGTPRPEEKKELWQVIFNEIGWQDKASCIRSAQAALQWALEQVDDTAWVIDAEKTVNTSVKAKNYLKSKWGMDK